MWRLCLLQISWSSVIYQRPSNKGAGKRTFHQQVPSYSKTCGIVGLPNVGKSCLFNAFIGSQVALSKNYPFCTIKPNFGQSSIPDQRLTNLAKISKATKTIKAHLKFVDIAGLIEGASEGKGLGNEFLQHIRNVDMILHLVRCFNNTEKVEVSHVLDMVDPLRDIRIINKELRLKDIDLITHLKKQKSKEFDSNVYRSMVAKVLQGLTKGYMAKDITTNPFEMEIIGSFKLLTSKPMIYCCNVEEESAISGNEYSNKVQEEFKEDNVVIVSAFLESEIATMEDVQERKALQHEYGFQHSALEKIVQACYVLLKLITFYTTHNGICQAWIVPHGHNARQCAAQIHGDMADGFIRAKVVSYADYISGGKLTQKVKAEGPSYLVQDGDVITFVFKDH